MDINITTFNFSCDGNFVNTFNFYECNASVPVEPQDYDIEIEFDSTYPLTYKLNNVSYTATTSPLKANLSDYGLSSVDEITSWYFGNSNVTKVKKLPFGRNITSTNSMFQACGRLESCITSDWDMSGVKDANFMFSHCANLRGVVFPSSFKPTTVWGLFGGSGIEGRFVFNTKECTDVRYLYYNCKNLNVVDFGAMESNQLIDSMFENCSNLEFTDGNFWPNDVTSASNLFKNCVKLPMNTMVSENKIGMLLNDGMCTNMSGLFYGTNWGENYNFETYRLLQWNLNNILNCSYLFAYSNISKIEIASNFWDLWRCQDFSYMFANMPNLTKVNFGGGFGNATTLSGMFENCPNLEEIELTLYDTPSDCDFSNMFVGCNNLNYFSISMPNGADCNFINNIRNAISEAGLSVEVIADGCSGSDGVTSDRFILIPQDYASGSFSIADDCDNIVGFQLNENSVFNKTLDEMINENGMCSSITGVSINGTVKNIVSIPTIETLQHLTIRDIQCDYLDLSSVYLNNLTRLDISYMPNLLHIDFSNWETVSSDLRENNNYVWEELPNLKTIKMLNCSQEAKDFVRQMCDGVSMYDVIIIDEDNNYYITTKADTSTFDAYFYGTQFCQSPVCDINDWGYSSLNDNSVSYMFENQSDLKGVFCMPSLSATTSHFGLLNSCNNLEYFDGKRFDFNWKDGDQDISNFFNGCGNITWIDLSGWDLSNAYNNESMLNGCDDLKYIFAYGCNEETIGKIQSAIDNSGYSGNMTLFY